MLSYRKNTRPWECLKVQCRRYEALLCRTAKSPLQLQNEDIELSSVTWLTRQEAKLCLWHSYNIRIVSVCSFISNCVIVTALPHRHQTYLTKSKLYVASTRDDSRSQRHKKTYTSTYLQFKSIYSETVIFSKVLEIFAQSYFSFLAPPLPVEHSTLLHPSHWPSAPNKVRNS